MFVLSKAMFCLLFCFVTNVRTKFLLLLSVPSKMYANVGVIIDLLNHWFPFLDLDTFSLQEGGLGQVRQP